MNRVKFGTVAWRLIHSRYAQKHTENQRHEQQASMRRWSRSWTDIWTSTKESPQWIKSGRILFLRNTNTSWGKPTKMMKSNEWRIHWVASDRDYSQYEDEWAVTDTSKTDFENLFTQRWSGLRLILARCATQVGITHLGTLRDIWIWLMVVRTWILRMDRTITA